LDENGIPVNYKSSKRVQATAYTHTGNKCSTGVWPKPGYIAVDPKVIPYGTKMYIVSADGKYVYGYAIAADTGGFIKKRPTNVDLFMHTESACRKFGRRDVIIYFL
jgi:3D (Asp-Asp-Asp) domain-containing protein